MSTFDISQPDLTIQSITPSDPTPNIGQQIDMTVVVQNVGSADAGAFRLSFVPDSTDEPAGDGCDIPDIEYITDGLACATAGR